MIFPSFLSSIFIMTHIEGTSKTPQPPPALIHSSMAVQARILARINSDSCCRSQCSISQRVGLMCISFLFSSSMVWYTVALQSRYVLLNNQVKCLGSIVFIFDKVSSLVTRAVNKSLTFSLTEELLTYLLTYWLTNWIRMKRLSHLKKVLQVLGPRWSFFISDFEKTILMPCVYIMGFLPCMN